MAVISAQNIPGVSVYGIQQVSYTVNGVAGKDYAAAVAAASLWQATALEQSCSAMSAMVKQRMKKLDDLGWALAVLNETLTTFRTKNPESDDKGYHGELQRMDEVLRAYGFKSYVSTNKDGDYYITRENANYAQNDVQYAMDREDNDLQQDLVSIQSMFSKRDNSFSTAKELVSKIFNTSQSITSNFGG